MNFSTFNPDNGEKLQDYSYLNSHEIEAKLTLLERNSQIFRQTSIQERAQVLLRVAEALRKRKSHLARQMALEMGKPLLEGESEIEKCAMTAEYFSEHLPEFLQPDEVNFSGQKNRILKQPLGPVFAIMPWNFPYWQTLRFAAPALAVGNVIWLKHSDQVAGCAQLIEEVFREASLGYPLLLNGPVSHEQAAQVIEDPRIRGVTFTGSTRGGQEVAAVAGRALKKSVLELGGSDPYLVLQDADIELAASVCAKARLVNNGQSCVAAKRFFVHRQVLDSFLERFLYYLKTYKVGSPLAQGTQVGPLSHKRFQAQIHEQVQRLKGRHVLLGGTCPQGAGAYYPPTAVRMDESSDLWREEFFGPVALIWTFESEESALQQANHSIYGLGGAVFSRDLERAWNIATRMECGFVAINDMVRSDPRLPFGGVKDSGYGRELSRYGVLEFCNIKTIAEKV